MAEKQNNLHYQIAFLTRLKAEIVADAKEHPKGLTCGQIIEQFFPDPICDGCKRKGDTSRCTALFFQERDEKRKMLKEEMEDEGKN